MINKAHVVIGLISLSVFAACTSSGNRAPVVEHFPSRSMETAVSSDGYYTVKSGDTLYAIALDFGLDWRELARANGLADPGKLLVGQKILVEGLSGHTPAAIATAPGPHRDP